MDAEMLEQKAKQAAADVMLYMRRLVSAVEAREKDILNIIEKTRVAKFAALKAKDESLRNDKARLMRATDRLSTAMKSCSSTCNPKNLLASKDMALAEVSYHNFHNLRTIREIDIEHIQHKIIFLEAALFDLYLITSRVNIQI